MGIFSSLFGAKRPDYLASPDGVKSPFSEGGLSTVILQDLLAELFAGQDVANLLPLTREEALSIPAVSKARNLLVSTVARFPLLALSEAGEIDDQPEWMYRTDGDESPQERIVNTVDDGIFYGTSAWLVERDAADAIHRGAHLDWDRWEISDKPRTDGRYEILVDKNPIDSKKIIFFNWPGFDGLLTVGRRTLRGARDTELAWTSRIRNPIPLTELDVIDDSQLEQGEADAWLAAWEKKHRAGEPAIGMTPPGMAIKTHGEGSDSSLYIENRNAVRTDVGSFVNVRSSMLDGTAGIDSLTYSTTEGERNAFYEFDLPFWTDPIEWRLSRDDVVAEGVRSRFDKYEQYANPTPTPTGAVTND